MPKKMKVFRICCLFIVISLGDIVRGDPNDNKSYDDEKIEFRFDYFEQIYELAIAVGERKHSGEFEPPYHFSDYLKVNSSTVPSRFKQRLVNDYERFRVDIGMSPEKAAFEAVRSSAEHMMDVYQGRLHTTEDITRFVEIRQTEPMRFMIAASQHDKNWHVENARKIFWRKENPTFEHFREFVRLYYRVMKPSSKSETENNLWSDQGIDFNTFLF